MQFFPVTSGSMGDLLDYAGYPSPTPTVRPRTFRKPLLLAGGADKSAALHPHRFIRKQALFDAVILCATHN
jgi:hypothetical protein